MNCLFVLSFVRFFFLYFSHIYIYRHLYEWAQYVRGTHLCGIKVCWFYQYLYTCKCRSDILYCALAIISEKKNLYRTAKEFRPNRSHIFTMHVMCLESVIHFVTINIRVFYLQQSKNALTIAYLCTTGWWLIEISSLHVYFRFSF